jgi:hypothetical protein
MRDRFASPGQPRPLNWQELRRREPLPADTRERRPRRGVRHGVALSSYEHREDKPRIHATAITSFSPARSGASSMRKLATASGSTSFSPACLDGLGQELRLLERATSCVQS